MTPRPRQEVERPSTWRGKFANAFRGVRAGAAGQGSFAVHAVAAVAVVALAAWLRVEPLEWCLLVFAIGLVVTTELLNSSLEHLARAVTEDHHPLVGAALDIASGAVLIAAATSVLIGAVVFAPRLLTLAAG